MSGIFLGEIVDAPVLAESAHSDTEVVKFTVQDSSLGLVVCEWMPGAGQDNAPCQGDIVLVAQTGGIFKAIASYSKPGAVEADATGAAGARTFYARKTLHIKTGTDPNTGQPVYDDYGFPISKLSMDNEGNVTLENYEWTEDEENPEQKIKSKTEIDNTGKMTFENYDDDGNAVCAVLADGAAGEVSVSVADGGSAKASGTFSKEGTITLTTADGGDLVMDSSKTTIYGNLEVAK